MEIKKKDKNKLSYNIDISFIASILGEQMFLTEVVITFNDKQYLEHRLKVCDINLHFRMFTTGCIFEQTEMFSGSISCIIPSLNMHDIYRVLNTTYTALF